MYTLYRVKRVQLGVFLTVVTVKGKLSLTDRDLKTGVSPDHLLCINPKGNIQDLGQKFILNFYLSKSIILSSITCIIFKFLFTNYFNFMYFLFSFNCSLLNISHLFIELNLI